MLKVYTPTLVISDVKHLLRDITLYVVNRLIVNVLLETLPNILSRATLDRIATLSQVADLTVCASALARLASEVTLPSSEHSIASANGHR